MSIGSIGTMPGSWNPIDGFVGTPLEPLRDTVGSANTAAARARRMLHEASLALALEKLLGSGADVLMREALYRWFDAPSSRFERRSTYHRRQQPTSERRVQVSQAGPVAVASSSSTQLVVNESRYEARLGQLTQEALLARELALLEAELVSQSDRDERRHVRDSRGADLCAAVRERILTDELRASEANAMATQQLSAVLRELDEQRGAISRLAMDAVPVSEARIRLLADELRQVEESGGAEAQRRAERLEAELAEMRRRERAQENEIRQLRAALAAAEARAENSRRAAIGLPPSAGGAPAAAERRSSYEPPTPLRGTTSTPSLATGRGRLTSRADAPRSRSLGASSRAECASSYAAEHQAAAAPAAHRSYHSHHSEAASEAAMAAAARSELAVAVGVDPIRASALC